MSKEKAAELLNKIEFNIGIRHSEQIGDYSKFEAKVYKMLEDPTQADICCK